MLTLVEALLCTNVVYSSFLIKLPDFLVKCIYKLILIIYFWSRIEHFLVLALYDIYIYLLVNVCMFALCYHNDKCTHAPSMIWRIIFNGVLDWLIQSSATWKKCVDWSMSQREGTLTNYTPCSISSSDENNQTRYDASFYYFRVITLILLEEQYFLVI